MAKPRVQNRNNPRYLKVQKAIDKVLGKFIKRGHVACLKVSEVTNDANIFVSTFYDHHKNLDDAIKYLNNKMKKELNQLVKETSETHCSLEIYYSKLLYFISKNKNYYDIAIKTNNIGIIMMAIESAKTFVIEKWPGKTDKEKDYKFYVLSWQICSEIWWWGEKEYFAEEKLGRLVRRLSTYTNKVSTTYLEEL